MRRSTRNKREPVIESSTDDEDDHVTKKAKTLKSRKNKVPRDEDESSSESDIENYLQPADKLNLMSSFFDVPKKDDPKSFEKLEKDIFAGVTRLSDSSDSDVEMETVAITKSPENPEVETMEVAESSENAAKLTFRQLEDYTKQMEEAKKQIALYEAKKKKKQENSLDISTLLKAGENVSKEASFQIEDLHSSDFESCESDGGWEEVKVVSQEESKDQDVVSKDGLQITVAMPDTVRKKKGIDLIAAMKRRLNRIRKENQVLVHKVHLLCWLGHGNYVNACINKSETLGLALSLLPSEKAYPSERTDLNYLEQILKWYKKTMKMVENASKNIPLDEALQTQITKKEVYNKKMLCYIFIAILRALGMHCRLVFSLQVEPLRPPSSDLHSLSSKTKDDQKKGLNSSSTSTQNDTGNSRKLNTTANKKPSSSKDKDKKSKKEDAVSKTSRTKANAAETKQVARKSVSKESELAVVKLTDKTSSSKDKKSKKEDEVSKTSKPKANAADTNKVTRKCVSKESELAILHPTDKILGSKDKKSEKEDAVSKTSRPKANAAQTKKVTRKSVSKESENSTDETSKVKNVKRNNSSKPKHNKNEKDNVIQELTKHLNNEKSTAQLEVSKKPRGKSFESKDSNHEKETNIKEPATTSSKSKPQLSKLLGDEEIEKSNNKKSTGKRGKIESVDLKSMENTQPKKTRRNIENKNFKLPQTHLLAETIKTRSKSPKNVATKNNIEIPSQSRNISPVGDNKMESNSENSSGLIKIMVDYEKDTIGEGNKVETIVNKMTKPAAKENIITKPKAAKQIIKIKLPERNKRKNNIPQLDGNFDSSEDDVMPCEPPTKDIKVKEDELSINLNNNSYSEPSKLNYPFQAKTNGDIKFIEPHFKSMKLDDTEDCTPHVNNSVKKENLDLQLVLNEKRNLVVWLERIEHLKPRKTKEKQLVVMLEKMKKGKYHHQRRKQSKVVHIKNKIKNKKKQIIKIKWPSKRNQRLAIPQVDGNYSDSSDSDYSDVPVEVSEEECEEEEVDDFQFITRLVEAGIVDPVLQLDGANDLVKKISTSKPDLKKLKKVAEKPCSVKDHPKRLRIDISRMVERDSEEEFSPRSPFTKKNFDSPKVVNLKKLNAKKTEATSKKITKVSPVKSSSPYKSPFGTSKYYPSSSKQLDVRNDIISLVKGRIAEQKHIDRVKMVKTPIKKKKDSDSDSDYAPEPIKKKHHESDDEFVPKIKVKQRVQVKRKVLSSESDNENDRNEKKGKGKNKGIDVWCEVFLEAEEKWISVDVVFGQVHCVNEIYSRATHPVSYIVAWNNDNSIKDITARYCQNFNTVIRKLRTDSKWWQDSIKPFEGTKTARDREEDDELQRQQLEKPLPKVISEYKNHPLYVLTRHLLKFEAIYPSDASTLGFIRGEPVYSRSCVYTLHSRDIWLKQAKVVKLGEKPYKIVKARPKYDKLSNTMITDQLLEIFGPWQVEDYEPPTAENGVVPRNAFGNVDLFKPCMLPKKTVHLKLPGLNKIARRMDIDCASAIVGFDFHNGWSHPMYDGFVVCEEFEEQLVAAWELEQEELDRKEEEKIEKRVYGNWRKMIKGLLIRERLKAKYDFGEPSNKGGDKKKKSKGVKFCTKKRRIHSDSSESDIDKR